MTHPTYSTNRADPDGVATAYISAVKAIDVSNWNSFAAGYRVAREAYGVADALLGESQALELYDMHQRDLQAALLDFEVTSAAEMIEKGALIALDTYDHELVSEALMRDLTRLGAARIGGGGKAAELGSAYLVAVGHAETAIDDDAIQQAWLEREAIWDQLVTAPVLSGTDAAAKVEAVSAWIDSGIGERCDGTDRAMLREVATYLKG